MDIYVDIECFIWDWFCSFTHNSTHGERKGKNYFKL